jgi:hypothetical protein
MVSFKPKPLYPRYALDRRLDVPQSRYGHWGEEKNFLRLPRNKPRPGLYGEMETVFSLGLPVRTLFAVPTKFILFVLIQ